MTATVPIYARIPVAAKARVEEIEGATGMTQAWLIGQLVLRGLDLPTPALDAILAQVRINAHLDAQLSTPYPNPDRGAQ